MKYSLLIITLLAAFFTACNNTNETNTTSTYEQPKVLTPATGGVDEVMFVMTDSYLDYAEDTIQYHFGDYYIILPQPEQQFKVTTVKHSLMNNLLYKFRNIVYITAYDANDPVLTLAKDVLGEELLATEQTVYYKRNVWAENQLVTFVIAPKIAQVNEVIAEVAPQLKTTISDSELPAYKKLAYANGVQNKFKEQLQDFYGINFEVPADFKLAENEGSFISMRRDTEKSIVYIWFDVEEYNAPPADFNRGVEMRNERGYHVSTDEPNTYMVSDSTFGFFTTKKTTNDLIIYENRGLWRMENDFMGGPFLNHYIIDQANNRVFLLDGFVFGPGDKKKKLLMRQLEGIFSSFSLMEE